MMNHDCVGNVRVSMDSGIINQDKKKRLIDKLVQIM